MSSGKKVSFGFALVLLLGIGFRVYLIHRERVEADKPAVAPDTRPALSDDELAVRRRLEPVSMEQAKALIGKPVWVAAGGQLDYFPYASHRADFSRSAGVLLGMDKLMVKDMFIQSAPSKLASLVPKGDKQILMAFTKSDSAKEYAVPVGYVDGPAYKFLMDDIFFYDDPRTIYTWPADVWTAIENHQAKPGMNELQTGLSLGQLMTSDSTDIGNRTVEYANNGKPVRVTFVKDKATSVEPGSPKQ